MTLALDKKHKNVRQGEDLISLQGYKLFFSKHFEQSYTYTSDMKIHNLEFDLKNIKLRLLSTTPTTKCLAHFIINELMPADRDINTTSNKHYGSFKTENNHS